MFESVTFRRSERTAESSMDLGVLAETLLFYKKANLMLDSANIGHLLRALGPSTTQRLITFPGVCPLFVKDALGVITRDGALPIHDVGHFRFSGTKEDGKMNSKHDIIQHIFERNLGKSASTKKAATAFAKKVRMQSLSHGVAEKDGLPGIIRVDLEDQDFVASAAKLVLQEMVPKASLGNSWYFEPCRVENGFIINTNLDFDKLNKEYHKIWPIEHSSLTPGYLLAQLLEARAGLHLASMYNSDLITTSLTSQIMQARLENVLSSQIDTADKIELFQNVVVDNGTAVRDAINSGERSFDEFLDLLERAAEFKDWLVDKEPDQSLVKQYYADVTATTWVEKLPAKSFRWAFFTGAGLLADIVIPTGLGTATGVALSAGDAFVLDKVAKGWKPNQFVDGPLRDFTS